MKSINPESKQFILKIGTKVVAKYYRNNPLDVPEDATVIELESVDELDNYEVDDWWTNS